MLQVKFIQTYIGGGTFEVDKSLKGLEADINKEIKAIESRLSDRVVSVNHYSINDMNYLLTTITYDTTEAPKRDDEAEVNRDI